MTVVAFDGVTMAADKRATSSGYPVTTTKVFRVGNKVVGLSGNGDVCRTMLQWATAGFRVDSFPAVATDSDVDMLVAEAGRPILCFGRGPFPLVIEDRFAAIGCGRDFALAAMHLGKSAVVAVDLACKLDVHCGNGIDALELQ